MDTTNLRAVGAGKGRVLHLVELGASSTLCGRETRLNPNYLPAGFGRTRSAAETDCAKCKRLAGATDGSWSVEQLTEAVQNAQADLEWLEKAISTEKRGAQRNGYIAEREVAEQKLSRFVTELGAAVQEQNR